MKYRATVLWFLVACTNIVFAQTRMGPVPPQFLRDGGRTLFITIANFAIESPSTEWEWKVLRATDKWQWELYDLVLDEDARRFICVNQKDRRTFYLTVSGYSSVVGLESFLDTSRTAPMLRYQRSAVPVDGTIHYDHRRPIANNSMPYTYGYLVPTGRHLVEIFALTSTPQEPAYLPKAVNSLKLLR